MTAPVAVPLKLRVRNAFFTSEASPAGLVGHMASDGWELASMGDPGDATPYAPARVDMALAGALPRPSWVLMTCPHGDGGDGLVGATFACDEPGGGKYELMGLVSWTPCGSMVVQPRLADPAGPLLVVYSPGGAAVYETTLLEGPFLPMTKAVLELPGARVEHARAMAELRKACVLGMDFVRLCYGPGPAVAAQGPLGLLTHVPLCVFASV